MNTTYTIIIFLPLIIIVFFVSYKLLKDKFNIKNIDLDLTDEIEDGVEIFLETKKDMQSSLEHAKEILFKSFFYFYDEIRIFFKKTLNIILHFFVIAMGMLSDFTDMLYAKSRNFFLRTASKEKETVSRFWHTLKEYRKEIDEEKKDE